MTRRRILIRASIAVASLLLLLGGSGWFILQSEWFYEKVRSRMIAEVEKATGGRVEIGEFQFDRKHLTAQVREFVLHGTEPVGKPPLFRAANVTVGLKLISLLKPSIDVFSVDVAEPRIYLIIGSDGKLNIPSPKIKRNSRRTTMETILDLAIDRFRLHGGVFEVEAQTRQPLDMEGRNLAIQLAYDGAVPRYRGTLAVEPLQVAFSDYAPQPFAVNLGLSLEGNRIAVDSGRLSTSDTVIELVGALDDFRAPHARVQYTARASVADIARIFRVPELRRGSGLVTGLATWDPATGIAVGGRLNATGVEYRDSSIVLTGMRADGGVEVGPKGVDARALRVAGTYVHGDKRESVEGKIGRVDILGRDIDIGGVAMTVLGGTFSGEAQVRDLRTFTVKGEVAGVQAMRAVALYSPERAPWDALVYGPVRVTGTLRQNQDLRAGAQLTLSPAFSGDPVSGHITAGYDAATRTLDLGRSAVALPHSRVEFSGVLGSELRAHVETRNLNDFLPTLGESAKNLPVKLNSGVVIFDGAVTGDLNSPRVAGHVRASNVTYSGEAVDSFDGDVSVTSQLVRVQNAVVGRGSLRAQAQGSVVLNDWKTAPSSSIAGNATLRNGALNELVALAGAREIDASGIVTTTAYATGTIGDPRVEADVEIVRGAFRGEPFERFTAHATHTGHLLQVRDAQLTAGAKQVRATGSVDYVPQHMDTGHVRFEVSTNTMALDSIRTLIAWRPDIAGSGQATARGEIELTPTARNKWRVVRLDGDVTAKELQMAGQPIGDAHITAHSQGPMLHATLESTAAGATVRGAGDWRMEDEYPGRANITFSKLNFPNLRAWLFSGKESQIAGSAEGELRIEGPALNWKAMQAELRIPALELGPAPDTELASELSVHNEGPIVAKFANSVITIENAHLVGRGTDLTATGKLMVDQKQPLDLRVEGHADLSFLHDFVQDVQASGTVATSATIRGAMNDPQVTGRMEFQKAAFNITDIPNGISNATGVVIFTKDRATIQSLSGETGGGKIDLTGFAGYGGGNPIVFRIHARAREVRVRYPEGVSTVANASLNFSGTEDSSTLSGTVTVLRTGINLQSDFSSILAKSAEPVRTPSAQGGLLGGMSFDIQVQTAPETEFQSTLTEGVQAEANLRLRGTMTNPAVLGRVNITQGKLQFFGTQYTLNQGTVSFYNPVKVEPILNIDLETKARGIDITLTVSGPLNKLTLTPRSDPPLQFSEIVALLAQGRTPTSDPTLLRRQSDAPQTFQQAGASALLGSAITNPVAGRLQRFFGVSKLRIDPSLSGVENNPQARLTLEQQITPNLTFTYITNVTTTNPQVVRVEWSVSKEWSVVALREENGLLGLDFFYKRRFK